MSNVINKFTTFYRIPLDEDFELLQKDLITYDFRSGESKPFGYVADSDGRYVRVPAGIGDAAIKACYPKYEIVNIDPLPFVPHIPYKVTDKPYDFQQEIIDDIVAKYKEGRTQAICDIPTGNGKTFTAINIIHALNTKAIIFVKTVDLALQWIDSYKKHTNLSGDAIFFIQGLGDIIKAKELADEHNIFIITHASIRNFYLTYGFRELYRLFTDLGIGMKVYDEFDLEVKNTLLMDCYTCIRYNLYLTATVVKSSYSENEAFKFMYQSVFKTGKEHFKTYVPERRATVVFYHSKPNQAEFKSCFDWNMNFVADKYMSYMMNKETFYEALAPVVEQIKNYLPSKDLKYIFYVGKIINCDIMKAKLNECFDIPLDNISVFNSTVSRRDKEKALANKIITSTTDSMGRGLDIKGLKVIVNCEVFGSESIFKQLTGRIGRKGGNEGFYYEVVDLSFKNCYILYKKRAVHFKSEFKEIKYINIKDNGKAETAANELKGSFPEEKESNEIVDVSGKGVVYTTNFYRDNKVPDGVMRISTVRKMVDSIKIPNIVQMPDLSPSYKLIFKYKDDKDYAFYELAFYEEMRNEAFKVTLQRVRDLLDSGQSVCLMAYEPAGIKSHRNIIADLLAKEGYKCKEIA